MQVVESHVTRQELKRKSQLKVGQRKIPPPSPMGDVPAESQQ